SLHQQTQAALVAQFAFYRSQKIVPFRNIRDAGFRVYSQFEEDGIILYVLAMIGFKSRKVVEICCGSGHECMATNLILNHGFEGFLFDGDEANINRAVGFFRSKKDCIVHTGAAGLTFRRPTIARAWITAESVNDLLRQSGCTGEADLLSLDIDGNEYWIWKALDAISPRLLVVETQNIIPADKSLTIPYRPDFSYHKAPAEDFRGASLLAV